MDRGIKNYSRFINKISVNLSINSRVMVVHDVHLPTCLKNAIGTVTINSTVGLSSLYHKTPTIALGRALYDIEGLTCKGMRLKRFLEWLQGSGHLTLQKVQIISDRKDPAQRQFLRRVPR